MTKKIAVLILGYNHKEFLKDVLDSALKQTYSNYDVTYIDNASSDNSTDFVVQNYPSVKVVSNTENTGYAGAYHTILQQVFSKGYDAAILLNPDTIVDENWLSELVASAYADDSIALAQSKVLIWNNGPTKTINTFGNVINFLGFGYCGHYKEEDTFTKDQDITYASGASLLIKKEYYPEKIQFDTDYFAYLEDQDLGWQAKILGYRTIASARSIAWHKYDFQKKKLNNFKFFLLERNRLTFLVKFLELKTLILIFPALVIMDIGIFFNALAKGYFFQKVKSEMDFLKNLLKTLRKRRKLQKNRAINDRRLFLQFSPIIAFEEVDSPLMKIANKFLEFYNKIIKKLL